jgi:hypothetical protein
LGVQIYEEEQFKCVLLHYSSVGQKLPNEAVSSDSDYVHDDTFSEMEEEGLEEIP